MFDFNVFNQPEPFNFYLCKPNREIMYELNGINKDTAFISVKFNNQQELSFDYYRYTNQGNNTRDNHEGVYENDNLVETNGYHNLVIGMLILVDKIGYFKIKYPPMKYDGNYEYKTITASSIECELEENDLVNFKINTGEKDSAEYLVEYDNNETEELINEYTGIPYDWITFYNTFPEQLTYIASKYDNGEYTNPTYLDEIIKYCKLIPRLERKLIKDSNGNVTSTQEYVTFTYNNDGDIIKATLRGFDTRARELISFYTKYRKQLSLLDLALEKCDCNWTIGYVDKSLVNMRFQFDVNNENIYSFFTNDISKKAYCIFEFDIYNRVINVRLAMDIGVESGIIIDKGKLLNTLDVSCNADNIYTRINVSGGDGLDIKEVNFGSNRITDLSYFMNARDENSNRIYVSDELATKYEIYVNDVEIVREKYIQLSKEYNKLQIKLDDIKYKLPNDSLNNDWDTFTDEELEKQHEVYHKLLATLQSLYREDYGDMPGAINPDDSINEDYIKTTEYWYDYYAYKNTIEQISVAIEYRDDNVRYHDITNETALSKINAYKTEWTLYGTVELENIISKYNNVMKPFIDDETIVFDSNGRGIAWSNLTTVQKTTYGNNQTKYTDNCNTYNKNFDEKASCQTYLTGLTTQIDSIISQMDSKKVEMKFYADIIQLRNYDRSELRSHITIPDSNTVFLFSDEDIKTINLLYSDNSYDNSNILTTSLDNVVTRIDKELDLLNDAKHQISIISQPQISFAAEIEDILSIPEFKDFKFSVGNFVTVQYYDDYYVNLRLVSMSFNPCVPESSLTIEFSNFIKDNAERSDITNILGLATGNGFGSGSSSGGGSGSSTYGESDDIDVTISNTMLSKLLNTETFGTRVSDIVLNTIKVNQITAKYAKFESLANGTTIIDGGCITTGYIKSHNYNGTRTDNTYNLDNTTGSILSLSDGRFNFAGGNLKFDGSSLYIRGRINAEQGGTIGGWAIGNNSIYRGNGIFGDSGSMYIGENGLSIGDYFTISSSPLLSYISISKEFIDEYYSLNNKCKIKTTLMSDGTEYILYYPINGDSGTSYVPSNLGRFGADYVTYTDISGVSYNEYNLSLVVDYGCSSFDMTAKSNVSGPFNLILTYDNRNDEFNFYTDIDMHNYNILNNSDIRLKTNVKETSVNALSLINSLELKEFDWIKTSEHEEIGLIAQQLREIIPSLIAENKTNGKLSIKTDKFIPYILKAIQELSGKNIKHKWKDDYTLEQKQEYVDKVER